MGRGNTDPNEPAVLVEQAHLVPSPEDEPTISVARAGRACGVGRNAAYEAVHRGEIPVVRIGRYLRVPTAELRRKLGLDLPAEAKT